MGKASRHPEGLLLSLGAAEMARLEAAATKVGLNGLTDDSIGAVIGRPVRIALLDGSLLERQFWLMLFFLAPSWELVAISDSLEDLTRELAAEGVQAADLVIADPTGLCKQCPVSCLGDLQSCPLLSHREVIEKLPPMLLHLRKGDMNLACRAMQAGVKGLQLHRRGLMGLRDAVLAIVNGNVWIDPDLSTDLLGLLRSNGGRLAPATDGEIEVLVSEREQEVLLALEKGAKVADVARSLVLSENTIKTHLRRIYEKLDVDNRHDAVMRARLTGQLN
ncbi:response regulator transcription factor [Cyanobium sp. HWJ4-Hawea]|uniref:response regulator transcription factor n=1 Tax=Cyanobium sp. HWJ4-Hawea TaxID=2823713 RepID=UPI0020CE9DA0|nr:response regulator transcription factor [Cyanobium sp. HWJ4-Hawea]MCP9809723.1 response regulator transcription factor [Cyanobium sp. HWJ4-Hawea]